MERANHVLDYASLIWIIVFGLFNLFLVFIGLLLPMTCYEYSTVEEVKSCARGMLALFVGVPILTTLIGIVLYARRRYIFAMLVIAIPGDMLLVAWLWGVYSNL